MLALCFITCVILVTCDITTASRDPEQISLTTLGGKKYFFGDSYLKTWSNAQTFCRSHGMELATIETKAENDRLKNKLSALVQSSSDVRVLEAIWWIGASDTVQEGRFVWSGTGRPTIFTNWALGEPNNRDNNQHYVAMQPDGTWGDYTGSGKQGRFICEKERL